MTFDDLFAMTPTGDGRWTAPGAPPTDERMVFGGLVVGQAIVATSVDTRRLHALHSFFIGMGAKEEAFDIRVERTRDGGSFSTRHVQIRQGERLLLAGYTSHHNGDPGPEHQEAMPEVTPPDKAEDFWRERAEADRQQGKPAKRYLFAEMLEMRGADLAKSANVPAATQAYWVRARERITGGEVIHQAAIGFASDVGMIRAGAMRHSPAPGTLQTASLDHSIWFHREAPADDWLLQVTHSSVARTGRGLSQASIFTRKGDLVASVAQEFLARHNRPAQAVHF